MHSHRERRQDEHKTNSTQITRKVTMEEQRDQTLLAHDVLRALQTNRVDDAENLLREQPHLLSVCPHGSRIGIPLMHIICAYYPSYMETLFRDLSVPTEIMNHRGETPLFKAKNAEIVKILIGHKANVNHISSQGDSPLLNALYDENLEIMKILISAGADVNFTRFYGWSLLTEASSLGNCKAVQLLLDAGARYTPLPSSLGYWPLRVRGFKDILEVFYNHDSTSIEQTDMQGHTVLHMAVAAKQTDCVQFLLEKGADIFVRTLSGPTPFQLAVEQSWLDGIYLMTKSNPAKILCLPHEA